MANVRGSEYCIGFEDGRKAAILDLERALVCAIENGTKKLKIGRTTFTMPEIYREDEADLCMNQRNNREIKIKILF